MPDDLQGRVAEVVKAALERDRSEWTTFLRESCAGDEALQREAKSLLSFRGQADHLLDRRAACFGAAMLADEESHLAPGTMVDHYRIVSLIGRGGMGDVYLADDIEFGREVAFKIILRGFGSAGFLRRFRAEAKILASLNHPNIAQLYGGGVTTDGLPYFVMEYVEGDRLDRFCAAHDLGPKERLELFRKLCSAVSFAHHHLVIHRDLKPANIRATAEGEPKLLDFGIARLLEPGETEESLTLASIMTPDYASPEQLRGEIMTTASDVYSLGVILHELLTGTKPLQKGTTSIGGFSSPGRLRRRPGGNRQSPPGEVHLQRALPRDLWTIIAMALRNEPARRYASVGQLAEDIRRYLAGLPVMARPDTLSYRASRFVQRHRLAVFAAALLVCTLLGGITATTWEVNAARQEKAKAESVNDFLEEMIGYSNPFLDSSRPNGHPTTMSEMLDAAARRLGGKDVLRQPELRAELERVIGSSYYGLGRARTAHEHMQNYIDLALKLYRADDPRSLPAQSARATLLFGSNDFAASERLYREILPRMRQNYREGKLKGIDLVTALNNFAYLRRTQGDSHEAEVLFREVLGLRSSLPADSHFLVEVTHSTLASTLADEGKFSEALQAAREAVTEGQRAGRSDTPGFGFALTVLGGFLVDKGDFAEADSRLAQAENIFRHYLAPAHLWLGDSLRNQAISFYRQGRLAEATGKNDEALRIYQESFGPHYDQYPTALITHGLILAKSGQLAAGEKVLREALKLRTDSLPPDHFWVALAEQHLGECLSAEKRTAEAGELLRSAYEKLSRDFGPSDPRTQTARQTLNALDFSFGGAKAAALAAPALQR